MTGDEAPLYDFLGIVICLALSAFFSGSETVLTSISTTRVNVLLNEEPAKWGILKVWLGAKRRILAALLIGNNLVNILASILAYRTANYYWPNYAEAISVFGLTLVVLIFAEITPKGFALQYAEKLAISVMRIVWLLDKVLYPLSWLLSKLPMLFHPGIDPEDEDPVPSEDEIRYHLEKALDQGVFTDKTQVTLLMASMNFSERLVREVLIPRTELTMLEQSTTIKEALDNVISSGHSRVPVFKETPDSIVGILYAKDLLSLFNDDNLGEEESVQKVMRTNFFYAPEIQKINLLLTEMRRRSSHMAIVVDEFGGTSGIITLEDIIEELVGEIHDEHDVDEPEAKKVEELKWVVDAMMSITDFENETGVKIPSDVSYESIGGYAISLFGKIPRKGQVASTPEMRIAILEADDRCIKSMEVKAK